MAVKPGRNGVGIAQDIGTLGQHFITNGVHGR